MAPSYRDYQIIKVIKRKIQGKLIQGGSILLSNDGCQKPHSERIRRSYWCSHQIRDLPFLIKLLLWCKNQGNSINIPNFGISLTMMGYSIHSKCEKQPSIARRAILLLRFEKISDLIPPIPVGRSPSHLAQPSNLVAHTQKNWHGWKFSWVIA